MDCSTLLIAFYTSPNTKYYLIPSVVIMSLNVNVENFFLSKILILSTMKDSKQTIMTYWLVNLRREISLPFWHCILLVNESALVLAWTVSCNFFLSNTEIYNDLMQIVKKKFASNCKFDNYQCLYPLSPYLLTQIRLVATLCKRVQR